MSRVGKVGSSGAGSLAKASAVFSCSAALRACTATAWSALTALRVEFRRKEKKPLSFLTGACLPLPLPFNFSMLLLLLLMFLVPRGIGVGLIGGCVDVIDAVSESL